MKSHHFPFVRTSFKNCLIIRTLCQTKNSPAFLVTQKSVKMTHSTVQPAFFVHRCKNIRRWGELRSNLDDHMPALMTAVHLQLLTSENGRDLDCCKNGENVRDLVHSSCPHPIISGRAERQHCAGTIRCNINWALLQPCYLRQVLLFPIQQNCFLLAPPWTHCCPGCLGRGTC